MDNPIIVNGISKTLTLQSFGVSIQFSQGLKSQSKTLPFQQILTAVVVKPGLTAGYIYFQLNGVENRPIKNVNDAIKSENGIAFWGNDNYQKALQIKQAIEQWQANASMAAMQPTMQNVQAPSGAEELLKYKQLLDAGAITQEEFDEKKKQLLQQSNQTAQQTQTVQQAQPVYQANTVPPTPTKKKHGCLIGFIVVFLALAFLVGIIASNSGSGGETSVPESTVSVIVDASQFAQKDVAGIEEALGGTLNDCGATRLPTVAGITVEGQSYDYSGDGWYADFAFSDGKIVFFTCFMDEPVSYNSEKEILQMFGITPDGSMREVANTGMAIRWESVSSTVSEAWISSMDSQAKTFDIIRFTYNDLYSGKFAGGSSSSSTASSAASSESQPASDLEVLECSSTSDQYSRYVVGKIKNNTDHTYSYVQVEIGLYNGDTLVGSTLDNVNNLGPGEIWEFKAIILEDNCDKFKITGVTGF